MTNEWNDVLNEWSEWLLQERSPYQKWYLIGTVQSHFLFHGHMTQANLSDNPVNI